MEEQAFIDWVAVHWAKQEAKTGVFLSKDPVYLSACLMGEAAEVWEVVTGSTAEDPDGLHDLQLKLELGDTYHYFLKLVEFYEFEMEDIREAGRLAVEPDPRALDGLFDDEFPLWHVGHLMAAAALVWDVVKKAYRDDQGPVDRDRLLLNLGKSYNEFCGTVEAFGFAMVEIRALNKAKLEKRYGVRDS